MAIQPTYPGVYVQELASPVHTITGVATSITAFVGVVGGGPINTAVHIHNLSEFSQVFGVPDQSSRLGMAVQQFFLNGGADAYVVRLGEGATHASAGLTIAGGDKIILEVMTQNEGAAGNQLTVEVAADGPNLFKLSVLGVGNRRENYSGLSMNPQALGYVVTQINEQSRLIRVSDLGASLGNDDPRNTVKASLKSGEFSSEEQAKAIITSGNRDLGLLIDGKPRLKLVLAPQPGADTDNAHLADIAKDIQDKVVAAGFAGFIVRFENNRLVLTSGTAGPASGVKVVPGTVNDAARALKLLDEEASGASVELTTGNFPLSGGTDGLVAETPAVYFPTAETVVRDGVYALEDIDLFNLLVLPGVQNMGVLQQAAAYCEQRRAVLLIDSPEHATTPADMVALTQGAALTVSKNAAVYYPWLLLPDPNSDASIVQPPGGTVAGLIARTDATRGVWKAPAGTEANLVNVQGLTYLLTDAENGDLNPLGVNCLRTFRGFGPVAWGARTRRGADDLADQWKYLPVRRTALFIEESLYRGLKWVVFEPNDEPLWSQIRLNVGVFLHDLFRQGAFQGMTPRDAYFVKCDKETTTQSDIDKGIVNVLVGFAPLKPAEFVVLQLQQIAGQLQV